MGRSFQTVYGVMNVTKKVLIIYEKMGMGHLRMANIVEQTLKSESDLTIINQAGSDLFGINDVRIIDKLWNFCLRRNWIRIADVLINFMLRILFMPLAEISEVATIHNKLDEINPDIIISTADAWNHVLGSYAYEHKLPFYIIITDMAIFIDLVSPYATHLCYFPETANAIRNYDLHRPYFSTILNRSMTSFQKSHYVLKYYHDYLLGMFTNSIYRNVNQSYPAKNHSSVKITGPMADQKHFIPQNSGDFRRKLGINPAIPTVLISSGSIGGRFLLKIIKDIATGFEEPLNVLVMCGTDQKTYQKILDSRSHHPTLTIIPFQYQDNFEEFLAGSDCVIARPSAGVFVESLLHRTPVIAYGIIAANDQGTLEILNKYRTGEFCAGRKSLAATLRQVLAQKAEYQQRIDHLLTTYELTYESQENHLRSILTQHKIIRHLRPKQVKSPFTKEVII